MTDPLAATAGGDPHGHPAEDQAGLGQGRRHADDYRGRRHAEAGRLRHPGVHAAVDPGRAAGLLMQGRGELSRVAAVLQCTFESIMRAVGEGRGSL